MGRKKKETKTTQNVGYQGTVKITVMDGKRVVSTQESHNTGHQNLFKYLCYALQGRILTDYRPNRIVLFNDTDFASEHIVSPAVMIDSEPVVTSVTENSATYFTAKLHFRVPYAYINGQTVAAIAIARNNFLADYTDPAQELCATHQLQTPVTITESGNYSLIIEWTMAIKNA